MISKEEVVCIYKQHGLSPQDAKREFEKIDIDNDWEMPRNIAGSLPACLYNGQFRSGIILEYNTDHIPIAHELFLEK